MELNSEPGELDSSFNYALDSLGNYGSVMIS